MFKCGSDLISELHWMQHVSFQAERGEAVNWKMLLQQEFIIFATKICNYKVMAVQLKSYNFVNNSLSKEKLFVIVGKKLQF